MFTGSFPRYTSCARSIVITRRSSVISFTVRVFGKSTSIPDCKIGAVIKKITSSTSTTSTNGTMLMSESEVPVCRPICGIYRSLVPHSIECGGSLSPSPSSSVRLLHQRQKLIRKRIHLRPQVFDAVQEVIVGNHRGDRRKQSRRGRDQRFRNSRRHGAQARRSRLAQSRKRVNDSPHR